MSVTGLSTQSTNPMASNTTANGGDNSQRRSFPAWPMPDGRSANPGSEGCLTPPVNAWRGGRRNSDIGPNGSRTLSAESALSAGNTKQTVGGIAASDPKATKNATTTTTTTGRRRANSDLDRSTNLGELELNLSSNVSTVDETEDEDQLAVNARRDRDPKKSALYKTELCRSYEETGHCRYSAKCQFAHGMTELRQVQRHPKYKTEICRTFWEKGTCPYGKRCCFIHNEGPGSAAIAAAAAAAGAGASGVIPTSANGSSVSLASETISNDTPPVLMTSASTTTTSTTNLGDNGDMPLTASLATLAIGASNTLSDSTTGLSSTSSPTSSPMIAAIHANNANWTGIDMSSNFSLPTTAATATATTISPIGPAPVLTSQRTSPIEQSSSIALFPDLISSSSPGLTATQLPDPVVSNMWIQNTLLDDSDITSNSNNLNSSNSNSVSVSSCLLSSDLMQQLDIKPEIKIPQRSRAWTIDSTNDNARYLANPLSSDNRFGISHSNVDLSSIGHHGMSPSLLPATSSLLPASPALSAASVHSTNGGSGPLTPPVLGPIGGGLASSVSAAAATTTTAAGGNVLGMLPMPVVPGVGATTLRSISGRPRSSSVGTNTTANTNSSNLSSVSLLAGQSTPSFHHPSHYNLHLHSLHQPHGPSLLGATGSASAIDTAPIGAAITTTMAMAAASSTTTAAAIDSTEQRRLPVFRRFGHV